MSLKTKMITAFVGDYTTEEINNFLLYGGVCRLLEEFLDWQLEKGFREVGKEEDNG
jgi:hypothetical protein